MTLTLLPAIDVTGGRVARSTGEAMDPLEMALAWQAQGASWIHLVDMDAAFARGSNTECLARVVGALDIDVEVAGGVCDDESLRRALDTGCTRVGLSTAALDDRGWCARVIAAHGPRLALSLDVRVEELADGALRHRLSARGGGGDRGDLWETLDDLDARGCARYIVTDVHRDGMLTGPNMDLYSAITAATTAPIISSGGVASMDDLVAMAAFASDGANLEGAVVGRALHEERFTLAEALAELDRAVGS